MGGVRRFTACRPGANGDRWRCQRRTRLIGQSAFTPSASSSSASPPSPACIAALGNCADGGESNVSARPLDFVAAGHKFFFFPPSFLLCGGSPANDGRAARRRLSLCLPRKLQTHKHAHTCTPAQSCMAWCVSDWANVFENAVQCLDELGSVCRVCSQRLPRINRGVNVSPATGVDICRHVQILAFACTGF